MRRTKLRQRGDFKPKLIALSVAACFSVSATQGLANPDTVGATSSNPGGTSFKSAGNTLTIGTTGNTIIRWPSFSIGLNEITNIVQSSSASAVLNRVVGTNGSIPQSTIDGLLSSNGRVFLLNPSGVVIGPKGHIDVAGFVASSLNLSDKDFTDGRMRFTAAPGAGAVINRGVIDTAAGGRVFLIAPDVQNIGDGVTTGVIRSPQGEIVLAAGKSVELVYENSPFVTVNLTADSERALNVGKLVADSGRIGMFGALVRQGGVVEANSAVAGANGEIRLVATKDLTLDAGSLTTANGPGGGTVLLQAQGGTNLISGTVEAKGSAGQGGTIQALGVRVGVIGNGVIDASGDAGGGTVLVGGDYQGANPGIQNAKQTLIGPDGIIRADAGTAGDGGRVIVWSDDSTKFFGSISARGGSQSGNGGFVETSGAALQAFGSVDTRAPNGKGGSWLLDPDFIEIVATTNATLPCLAPPLGCAILFNDPSNQTGVPSTSQVSAAAIDGGLRTNGAVTLQAHKDINLLTDLTLNVGGDFTAQAGGNINLHGFVVPVTGGPAADTGFNIVANGTNIKLSANDASSGTPSGTGSITMLLGSGTGNISTNGGKVDLSGFDITVGTVTTASSLAGNRGGSVDLNAAGKVTVYGSIITSGALGSGVSAAGSDGGSVTITGLSATAIYGSIVTSGAGGYGLIGQGGAGGTAGDVSIISGGDVFVQGGISAQGGSGASSTISGLLGFEGGAGGLGGNVFLGAGGKVTVGASVIDGGGTIDVSGGSGGLGSQAALGNAAIPGGAGGAGGDAGSVQISGGQSIAVGNILAVGGVGGNGGDGILGSPNGGAGGDGGFGGFVLLGTSVSASVMRGTIRADGGAAGAGGAYGSSGGNGGSGGVVTIFGDTIDLSTGGAITAAGGTGGAGGVFGGNGGNGGLIHLIYGSSIVFTPPLDASVSGGAAGATGVTGGVAGTAGVDGTILISLLDLGTTKTPELDLATGTVIDGVGKAQGSVRAGIDDIEKKAKESKQKKDAAVCR